MEIVKCHIYIYNRNINKGKNNSYYSINQSNN